MAASNWLVWWKYGAHHDKLRGLYGKIETPLSLEELRREERLMLPGDDAPRVMPAYQIEHLRTIFMLTRRKHGSKERAGIERDIVICMGLVAGESTEGIGHELGINIHMVNRYRALLRTRLKRYLQGGCNA